MGDACHVNRRPAVRGIFGVLFFEEHNMQSEMCRAFRAILSSTVTIGAVGVAAVNANLAGFSSVSGGPVSIVRGGTTVGFAVSIQSGIDAALAGDVLEISAGT